MLESAKFEDRNPRSMADGRNIWPFKRCRKKQFPGGINNLASGAFPFWTHREAVAAGAPSGGTSAADPMEFRRRKVDEKAVVLMLDAQGPLIPKAHYPKKTCIAYR